jgi:hypothetical protein
VDGRASASSAVGTVDDFTSKEADADGGGTRFVGESRSAGECATLDIDGAATNATWKGREPTMIAPRGGSRLRIEAA